MKFHYFGDLSQAKSDKITVASKLVNGKVRIAAAYTNRTDAFKKYIGRSLAEQRLENQYIEFDLPEDHSYQKIHKLIIDNLLLADNKPSWADNLLAFEGACHDMFKLIN